MSSIKYLPHIDGLRAIAIVSVVLFHAGGILPGGFIGVDVFFVISGYLITGIILRDLSAGVFSLRDFWARRIKRILPALTVATLSTAALAWFLILPQNFKEFGQSLLAQSLSLANIYFYREAGYFAPASEEMPLLHTWSLSVEEQFYIILPLSLILLSKLRKNWIPAALSGLCIVSFALSIHAVHTSPDSAFYLLPYRTWELTSGGLIFLLSRKTTLTYKQSEICAWSGLLLLTGPLIAYDHHTPFPGLTALPPCAGTALLILSDSSSRTTIGKFLSNRFVTGLGLISYSLYLWHWPGLAFLTYYEGNPSIYKIFGVILISILIAYLSWRYVETPFRKANPTQSKTFALGSVMIGTMFLTGLAIHLGDGYPSRFSADANRFLSGESLWHDQMPKTISLPLQEIRQANLPCLTKTHQSNTNPGVLIWGDSHADALVDVFTRIGNSLNTPVYAATRGRLLPIFDAFKEINDPAERNIFSDTLPTIIQKYRIQYIFLHATWPFYLNPPKGEARLTQENLKDTVQRLKNLGVDVFIVTTIPSPSQHIPRHLALATAKGQSLDRFSITYEQYTTYASEANNLLQSVESENVKIISIEDVFFPEHRLLKPYSEGYPLFADHNHLSIRGANLLYSSIFDHFPKNESNPSEPKPSN